MSDDFLGRLKKERDDLQTRQDSLRKFIYGDKYLNISSKQQFFLGEQCQLQEKLLAVLNMRINDLESGA